MLCDRRAANLAQDEFRPAVPRQCAHRDQRAKIKARFRTDNETRRHGAYQPAQSGNGITDFTSGDFGDANGRIEQKTQRTIDAQRQNNDANTLGGQRVTEQDHIPLRASAFEGSQHYREIGTGIWTRIFGPRCHDLRRLSYYDYKGSSHYVGDPIKPELEICCGVNSASLI